VTVVAQWAKAPGIHGYIADSIPAVTPRYCTIKTTNVFRSTTLWRTLLTIFIPSTDHGCLVVKNLFFRRRGRKYLWVAAGIGMPLAVPSCLMGLMQSNRGTRVTALSGPLTHVFGSPVCLYHKVSFRGTLRKGHHVNFCFNVRKAAVCHTKLKLSVPFGDSGA
jgi:hypothetical protein